MSCILPLENEKEGKSKMNQEEKTVQLPESEMQYLRDLLLKEKPDTISYIFEAYELLRSLSLVVRLLDYKQIKPRTKTAWSIDAIRSILTDPLYCDFPSLFEPGIKEAHLRCQEILAEQTAGNTQTHIRSYCHVFSGLLYCSVCGKSISARGGKRKELGRSPANYSCPGKRNRTCNSRYISESNLGVFIFNLIFNLYQLIKHPESFSSVRDIEKQLLKNNIFPTIIHVDSQDLKMLLDQSTQKTNPLFNSIPFRPSISLDMIQMLTGSETDDFIYLVSPEEGVQKLNDSFFHEKSFDYWSLMDEVNPWILKEFLQQFVTKIYIDRGTVSSVTFKNDLTLHFIISNPVKNFTDFF